MKKILLLIIFISCMGCYVQALNTNTEPTVENIKAEIQDGTIIVKDWKDKIAEYKADGFSIPLILSIAVLLLLTIAFLGVCVVMILNIIEFFTPDEVDKKLDKAEEFITENFIKLPIKILSLIRGKTVKKI